MSNWNLVFWNKKRNNHTDMFLNARKVRAALYGGLPDDTREAAGEEAAEFQACRSNNDCGSGFSCIGGWCTNPYNDRGASNPGDCGPDQPNTPCKETFRRECSQPGSGCYEDKLKEDCCGNRTCGRVGSGKVICTCDDDDSRLQACSKFCTSFSQANGKDGPGCSDGITCGECFSCTSLGGQSRPICQSKSSFDNPPCWCSAGGGCASGQSCNRTTGECEDSDNKAYCYTSLNFSCREGGESYNVKVCRPTSSAAQAAYNSTLKSLCDKELGDDNNTGDESDPCKGDCQSVTTEGSIPPACPPGSSCKETGNISGGGKSYTITEICDKTDVPDSCKDCDCNCDDQCGYCQACSESGQCVPDPGCEDCGSDPETAGGRYPKLKIVAAWAPYNLRQTSGGGGTTIGLCKTTPYPGSYNSLVYYCGIGNTGKISYAVPAKTRVSLVTFSPMDGEVGGCKTDSLPDGACVKGLPNANARFFMTFNGSDPNGCTYVLYNTTNSALVSSSFYYSCSQTRSSLPKVITSPTFCNYSELNEMFNLPPGESYSVYDQYNGEYN